MLIISPCKRKVVRDMVIPVILLEKLGVAQSAFLECTYIRVHVHPVSMEDRKSPLTPSYPYSHHHYIFVVWDCVCVGLGVTGCVVGRW